MGQHIFKLPGVQDYMTTLFNALADYKIHCSEAAGTSIMETLQIDLYISGWAFGFKEKLETLMRGSKGHDLHEFALYLISSSQFVCLTNKETLEVDKPKMIQQLVEEHLKGNEPNVFHTVLRVYLLQVPSHGISRIGIEQIQISSDAQKKIEEIIRIKRDKLDRYAKVKLQLSELEEQKKALEEELNSMTPRRYDLEPDEIKFNLLELWRHCRD